MAPMSGRVNLFQYVLFTTLNINLHLSITLAQKGFSGYGDLFSSSSPTRRPCLLPPPSLRLMELRTGTNRDQCLNNPTLWGCYQICIVLVPFHNFRTNGGRLEKKSPSPVFGAQKKRTLYLICHGLKAKTKIYTGKKLGINFFWAAMFVNIV